MGGMENTAQLAGEAWPLVSVVMPCRNEARAIEGALRSLLDGEYQGELEILVIDGMSDDDTRAIVARVGDPRVRLLDNPRRITPSAMNLGIGAARGDVIARV